jgi:hypothetical protein
MLPHHTVPASAIPDEDWGTFPGGELAGRRPRTLCAACRAHLARAAAGARGREALVGPRARRICFECYRADLERERSLGRPRSVGEAVAAPGSERRRAAGSPPDARAAAPVGAEFEARWQHLLPFEPVNRPRLERLRMERASARSASGMGIGRFEEQRRKAQIAARRALQRAIAGLQGEGHAAGRGGEVAAVVHAAELQLPESWLPFVVSR